MSEQNTAWKATHHTYGDELWFGGNDGPGMWEIEGAEAYLPGDHDKQACLIAAAPDLLAALEASPQLDCHHDYHNSVCWPCSARAAIAKAKGETA